ncbi:hypothetical protein M667_15305 [Cellulophaga baltica NN016038]|nr:hypothetical protein M667_15305 [Cellulophaga baltica NN016038]
MSEDTTYCLVFFLITLFLCFLIFKKDSKTGIINFIVLISYVLIILVFRLFKSAYGNSLVWLVLFLVLSSIHIIVSIIYLMVKQLKKNNY